MSKWWQCFRFQLNYSFYVWLLNALIANSNVKTPVVLYTETAGTVLWEYHARYETSARIFRSGILRSRFPLLPQGEWILLLFPSFACFNGFNMGYDFQTTTWRIIPPFGAQMSNFLLFMWCKVWIKQWHKHAGRVDSLLGISASSIAKGKQIFWLQLSSKGSQSNWVLTRK